MSTTTESKSAFVSRFDRIWTQARRVQLWQALCWSLLTALVGISLLAALDYWLELTHAWRTAAIIGIGTFASLVAIWLAVKSVRRWRRQATAVAIEGVFPQLGQRIRTTVQFGPMSTSELTHQGVTTTMVAALEHDTIRRAQPLPLDAVIPWRPLAITAMLAAVTGMGLAWAAALDAQWRAAAQRAFLGDQPYTRITVEPGNLKVKNGESALIQISVEGRTGKEVALATRPQGESANDWELQTLVPVENEQPKDQPVKFEVPFTRIRQPLEYRVHAGSITSDIYRVDVLYPLKIITIQTSMQSPEYTGLPEAVSETGNISGLVGSRVKLKIAVDREAESAWLEIQDWNRPARNASPPTKFPLNIEGATLTTELQLTVDQSYSVFARSVDGMDLVENRFRIRVRKDEPPQVFFESPAEAIEVQTLAEILMRIRVSDDFGLSRAGIMFELNNEEVIPLLAEEFLPAAEELQKTGKLTPKTRAALEKVLPLEHFSLSQQDSVTYYAFVEDNRPNAPQRVETDLRFIDIRPFRRTYAVVDQAMNADGGPRIELKGLEELISRQRYALNRTIQIGRRFKSSAQPDLAGVDAMIKFESELARFTRESAEGFEALGFLTPEQAEPFYQAETAMLGATDSLSAGKWETATLQERDALKYLIEARNRVRILLFKNRNPGQLAQLRRFDRMQAQKLRRPKTDEEEAREIAKRLQELADQQAQVGMSLRDADTMQTGGQNGQNEKDQSDSQQVAQATKGEPQDEAKTKENGGDETQTKETGEQSPESKQPTIQELQDRQLDIVLESQEIEKVLGKLAAATDLTKQRSADASMKADEVAKALGNGALKQAKTAGDEAEKQFRELTEQVKALVAKEQADRIAAAQQMAANLARRQKDFVDKLATPMGDGGITEQPPMTKDSPATGIGPMPKEPRDPDENLPGLATQAEDIARQAQTLQDVLNSVSKSSDPQDEAAAKKVEQLVNNLKLNDLTQRLEQLPKQVGGGQMQDAKATAEEGAASLDAVAEQLSMLQRSIVSPKVDELAKLEAKIGALDRSLDELESPEDIASWHQAADQLLVDLEEASVSREKRQPFEEELKKQSMSPGDKRSQSAWVLSPSGRYIPPKSYHPIIVRLQDEIRDRIQGLMLGDLALSRDEPIPPQYRDLVDRFHQVLANEGRDKLTQGRRPGTVGNKSLAE